MHPLKFYPKAWKMKFRRWLNHRIYGSLIVEGWALELEKSWIKYILNYNLSKAYTKYYNKMHQKFGYTPDESDCMRERFLNLPCRSDFDHEKIFMKGHDFFEGKIDAYYNA